MKRALVVGASGQVGRQIVAALGPERAIGTYRANVPAGGVGFDLCELLEAPQRAGQLLREVEAEAVYCAAAMTHVDQCESEPQRAMQINCHAPGILAAAAAEAGIPFVFFSSEYVFDGKSGPYAEEAEANPISAYGRSKWMGECAVRRGHPEALIVRTTVVYGFDPAGKNFLYGLRRACLERRSFRVPVDQVSTPTYNKDIAHATIELVRRQSAGVFHVCGPERLNRYEFAVRATKAMGLTSDNVSGVATAELRQAAPRPLNAGLSTNKLRKVLPQFRLHTIEAGVQEWMNGDPVAAAPGAQRA